MMGVGELRGEGRNGVVAKSENCVGRLFGTARSGVKDVQSRGESNPVAVTETEEMMLGEAAMWSFGAKASISRRVFRR